MSLIFLLPSLSAAFPALFAAGAGRLPYYWHLPVLIVIISLVYSATRFDDWGHIVREAVRWGLRLFCFLVVIAIVLYLAASVI
jgi:hypothetical protein